ncbi:hypothetical protein I7100_000963 [Vibrio parahaemolyticus]|uniref:hypothetical protein n=1 Tax=Vibrio parahaemolyticus TaxID=670 RepID=UPI001121D3E5|nr:hypothetical protein [Vibrio parahaemolyticus]EGQ8123726.1 hypothetical protein [Vibrio parahaemolyticus]EJB8445084.1 hypothetical protein [Vibrio parahaemolyticus]EKL9959945.1 hypothetical protein [Vibrio parahaemolyticus]ELB2006155.1 hypothetical protein [Vibrio parahaemolyticus]TOJ99428.1 hypothetical protein CGI27_14215 [Vibrio parahaemolyticus]
MKISSDLKGKKILFIGIGFYDYDQAIIQELERNGAEVKYIIEGFTNRKLRIKNKLLPSFNVSVHHQNLINDLPSGFFDIIFVIKGAFLSEDNMALLKESQKKARFILYQWDSISRVPNARKILSYFDDIHSFDREDCNVYGFKFRPLFFRDEVAIKKQDNKKYDLSFVGWCHDGRIDVVYSILKKYNWLNFKPYLYATPREWISLMLSGYKEHISCKRMKFDDYVTLSAQSKCVLDIPHRQQTGLTIRTIETIGLGVKLITTNKDIVNYDFYNPNNILVLDRESPCLQETFFEKEYMPVAMDIVEKYSLSGWVNAIFGERNDFT